jgi:hypothetical protein
MGLAPSEYETFRIRVDDLKAAGYDKWKIAAVISNEFDFDDGAPPQPSASEAARKIYDTATKLLHMVERQVTGGKLNA